MWQKKMEEPDKEQVRNMLSALGKKPSEEQVNRFIASIPILKFNSSYCNFIS